MPRSRARQAMLAGLYVLAMPGVTRAHDFWLDLEPRGATVEAHLLIGPDAVPTDRYPRSTLHARRFEIIGPDQRRAEMPGAEGERPAGHFPADLGVHTVVYQSRGSTITLPAERFTHYLREEGLEHVIATRAARGEAQAPGRERFFRSAKAFARLDDPAAFGWYRGLALEIVVEGVPARGRLPVRLFFRGAPLGGVRLSAYRYRGGAASHQITAADGRATVLLDRAGPWLLTAVHMIEAPRDRDADWHSHWTALSLVVP